MRGRMLHIWKTTTTVMSMTASLSSFFSLADRVDCLEFDRRTSRYIRVLRTDSPPKGRTYMNTRYIHVM